MVFILLSYLLLFYLLLSSASLSTPIKSPSPVWISILLFLSCYISYKWILALYYQLSIFLFLASHIFTGIWTQGLIFARQAIYPLSHAPSPFDLVIFVTRSCIYAQVGLDLDSPIYASLHCWHARITPPHPAFIAWDVFLPMFFPRLGLNHDPPDLCLLTR
jgi:hypothetical protein